MKYGGYNHVLQPAERQKYVESLDSFIRDYSKSLTGIVTVSKSLQNSENPMLREIYKTFDSVTIFCVNSYVDCIILSKYLLLSSEKIEKSFFRGKLYVHMNESFKKLYGFTSKQHKNSEWAKIQGMVDRIPGFSDEIASYTDELERLSKYDWWKDVRNFEVHLDEMKLYELRQEPVNESKIIMETTPLIECFNKVNDLLYRMSYSLTLWMCKHCNFK